MILSITLPLPNRLIIQMFGGEDFVEVGPDSSTAELHTFYVHTGSGDDFVDLIDGLDVETSGDFTVDLGSGDDLLNIDDATIFSDDDIFLLGGPGDDALFTDTAGSGVLAVDNRLVIERFEYLFI